jgi:hypothetical protein
MNKLHCLSVWTGKALFACVLVFLPVAFTWAGQDSTIFTFDGQDFVRAHTTLMMEDGKSAEGTKLDRDSAAYKALSQNHSYVGQVTVFGKTCEASYAPLTDDGGKLTGALFVCLSK